MNLLKDKKHSIITVDFDDTLATTNSTAWGGYTLVPIDRVINFIKKQHTQGAKIYIVSFRKLKDKKEVEMFVKQHNIPVIDIICTSGQSKTPYIKKLNSTLHIDDDLFTLMKLELAGIDTLLVDWDQEYVNSTAKLFKKI
jgi:hypothetical protein